MKKKIKSQGQDEYIFRFIRLTASKCNSCVIDNKNYAVEMAEDSRVYFVHFYGPRLSQGPLKKDRKN